LITGRRTSQWKLLPDAIEMTLNFRTTTLECRVLALHLSLGIKEGIGMAQSGASGNRVLCYSHSGAVDVANLIEY